MPRLSSLIVNFVPKLVVLVLILCAQTTLAQTADSIQHHYDSLAKSKFSKVDSLRALHEFDSLKSGLSHKIDSLKGLNLSTEKYSRKLDSLNNIGPQKYIDKANAKLQSIEKKINDLPLEKAGIPDVNLKKINVDATIDNPIKGSIDNPLNKVDNPLANVNSPLSDNPLNKIENPLTKIDNPIAGELQTVNEKVADVHQATDQLQSYRDQAQKIGETDINQLKEMKEVKELPNAIEQKAASLDEIKELQTQTGEIDKMKGEVDKMKGMGNDPEALKQMAKQEITKQAVDHFKGKEQVLQQAMDKVSKLKEKYPDLSNLENIPKRRPNPMKNKPLIERFVPGLTFQIQKSSHFMIDLNPNISYRFTDRINAGAGWNIRYSFVKWNQLSHVESIYGPRAFGSFSFKKGFAVKAELEKMNTVVPPSALGGDGRRHWIWSAFVGMKKDYKFMGKVRGNIQVLYNIYDDHDNSPYSERLNVRMGFELPIKKRSM